MKTDKFKTWLDVMIGIWQDKKPNAIVDICAENFVWHEKPFDEPIATKDALVKEWESVLKQKNISVSYEILSIDDDTCITYWRASFESTVSEDKFLLDGIWKIVLDEEGKCAEFRQWYMSKDS